MRRFFLTERAPTDKVAFYTLIGRSALMCYVGLSTGLLPALCLYAFGSSYDASVTFGALFVLGVHMQFGIRVGRCSLANTCEMAIGGLLCYLGFALHSKALTAEHTFIGIATVAAGLVAHTRAYLDGPEPGGWKPLLAAMREKQRTGQ